MELHANEHTTLVVVELQRRGKKVGGKKNGEEKRAEGKERIDYTYSTIQRDDYKLLIIRRQENRESSIRA